MKKVLKVLLIVYTVLVTIFCGFVCVGSIGISEELTRVESAYVELKEESRAEVVSMLSYKLFYNAALRGNDYDLELAVSDAAEEYGLTEIEELTLIKNVELLIKFLSAEG